MDGTNSNKSHPKIINYWINNKINECGNTSKRPKPKIK